MWTYQNTDELCHYGVIGMRWGHRKSVPVNLARDNYNRAKGAVSAERANLKRRGLHIIAGTKNVAEDNKKKADYNKALSRKQKASYKVVDAIAKEKYNKKLKNTGNKNKAINASLKVHTKAMAKGFHGLPGSIADDKSGGQNTKYIKYLEKTKGKKYAQKVEKKYKGKLLRGAVATIAAIGAVEYALYKNI